MPGIEAYWSGAIQMGVKNLVLTVVELGGADDFVYEVGTAVMTVQLEGMTEPMEGSGKYVVIWKKGEDGTWKLHVDIFNTNAPAQ
jgi:ketosteroid isomerase-like protein